MGSLSNLYISQSYQSLIHIGTNNTASANLIELQDGLGNNIGVAVNTNGDLFLSGSLTASLQQGYLYVGGANGKTTAFATSSLVTNINTGSLVTTASFNSYTQSTNIRLNNLESTSASVNVSITNLNSTTSSFATSISNLNSNSSSVNTSITNLNASSASQQVSIDALNTFTASQSTASIVTSINNLNTFSASALVSISNINSTTASLLVETQNLELFSASALISISNLNLSSASQQISIDALNTNSASVNISISNINSATASLFTSVNALNTFTASQSTASIVTSINNLNSFTQSANQRLGSLETNSASVNTSINTLNTNSASVNTSVSNLNTFTQSQEGVNTLLAGEIDSLQAKTGSYATTGSNNFIGDQTITGNISAFSASFTYLQTIFESSSIIYSSGSNQFGDELSDVQTLSGSVKVQGSLTVNGTPVLTSSVDISGLVTTASFNTYTQSNDQRVGSLETNSASVNTSITNINSTTASLNTSISNLNTFTASQSTASIVNSITELNTFSASALISISNLNVATQSLFSSASLALTTASFSGNTLTFTKGDASTFGVVIPDVSGSTINTGSFATTGSNTFRGNETFEDAGGNASTLVPRSGSLILVAKSFTSASAHLSSSFTNSVNLIFKNNDNTADTIISGSNNIFTNPTAPTAGFKRYIGTNSNIAMAAGAVPQISGSMGFSPTMANNYFGGSAGIIMRGPVSSSAWAINNNLLNNTTAFGIGSAAATDASKMVSGCSMTNNLGSVFIRVQAYKTALSSSFTYSTSTGAGVVDLNLHSSSINYGGNISYGGTTINNLYFPTTVDSVSGLVTINSCQFMGGTNIVFSGSNASMTGQTRTLGSSLMVGYTSASLVLNGDSGSLFATSILGAGLSVTGSNSRFITANIPNNDHGSVFVGRYNDQSGNKALSAQTVFAVGTGTANATANRKTGFLVDSGSNTFIEGTLNVSGSTSLTGSLTATGTFTASLANGFTYVGNSSNISTLVATSSFGGGAVGATLGANSFTGSQTITGSLIVSGSNTTFTSSVSIRGNTTFTTADGITSCIILGNNAMANAVGNTTNIAIGGSAMRYASGSQQNVALGENALLVTSGSNNFAIGFYAMESNTTGNENTAIGTGALNKNLAGGRNVGIGSGTLFFNQDGQNNIAIGYSAGNYVSESNNVHIGYQAGANMSGSRNVILGGYTGLGESGNDNIIFATGDGTLKARYNSGWAFKDRVDISGSLNVSGSTVFTGSVKVASTFQLQLPIGSNQQAGTAVLDGANPGTVTVSNSLVTANSVILLTKQTLTNAHMVAVSAKSGGSFTITSNGNGDSDTVGWFIINNS